MKIGQESETERIVKLQDRMAQRLTQLGFVNEPETRGNLIHHLAEVAVMGKKFEEQFLPAFFALPLQEKDKLQQLVVDMNYELMELKDVLIDLEPALIRLMNFVTEK